MVTTTNRSTPVQVSSLSGAIAVAGGMNHSVAVKSDGTVWGWGYNQYGELGDGTTTNRSIPVQVSGLNLGSTTTECTATAITASVNFLTIKRLNKSSVTVTVTGDGDCKVNGEKITARVDASGKKMVSVTPASAKTGNDGSTIFKIKAKTNTGSTRVTFSTADGLLSGVDVTVTN